MHGVDHRGRGAGASERVADIDDIGDSGAFAPEIVRHRDAQQALRSRSRDRLLRKSGVAIDRGSIGSRRRGDRLGPSLEIRRGGPSLDWCLDPGRGERLDSRRPAILDRGVLDVHCWARRCSVCDRSVARRRKFQLVFRGFRRVSRSAQMRLH